MQRIKEKHKQTMIAINKEYNENDTKKRNNEMHIISSTL